MYNSYFISYPITRVNYKYSIESIDIFKHFYHVLVKTLFQIKNSISSYLNKTEKIISMHFFIIYSFLKSRTFEINKQKQDISDISMLGIFNQ